MENKRIVPDYIYDAMWRTVQTVGMIDAKEKRIIHREEVEEIFTGEMDYTLPNEPTTRELAVAKLDNYINLLCHQEDINKAGVLSYLEYYLKGREPI